MMYVVSQLSSNVFSHSHCSISAVLSPNNKRINSVAMSSV